MNHNQTHDGSWICSNCKTRVPMNESHTCPTIGSGTAGGKSTIMIHRDLEFSKDDSGIALEQALLAFEEELMKHQIQMPSEFAKLIEKHFWELV